MVLLSRRHKDSEMILNILHRPDEPEQFHLFELEQRFAHDNGIRTTIMVTPAALADPYQISVVKEHACEFGDEIGLSFHGLNHSSVIDLVGYGQPAIWLYSHNHKRKIVATLADRFEDNFGFRPSSVAAYHLDASTMKIVSEEIPTVRAAIAGCFEEGVRVFHGCNHSWYLFNEGMPWGPWYPSRTHTLRPARDIDDWCGIVAVPHLMRDMVLSYEGRNDYWASHPPNVMRGMGYESGTCPYDRNLIDLFRWQEEFNDGYSYYNSFVSTAWLDDHHAVDDSPDVAKSFYQQQLEYLGELKRTGDVTNMTLTGFADWFREHRSIGGNECFFAKEILYGSGKHYFWYRDVDQRVLFDLTQGAGIGDLRPYVGEHPVSTGPESPDLAMGSYPYLIHSQHRTGMQHHSEDGSRSTGLLRCGKEEIDLGQLPTTVASLAREDDEVLLTTEPVLITLGGLLLTLTTSVRISGDRCIRFRRNIVSEGSLLVDDLILTERFKIAPGLTEYPQSLHGVVAGIAGHEEDSSLKFRYDGRVVRQPGVQHVYAEFPSIHTNVSLWPSDNDVWSGIVTEGHLFSPYITLEVERVIAPCEESEVCLKMNQI